MIRAMPERKRFFSSIEVFPELLFFPAFLSFFSLPCYVSDNDHFGVSNDSANALLMIKIEHILYKCIADLIVNTMH